MTETHGRLLLTGASGFVGKRILAEALHRQFPVRIGTRAAIPVEGVKPLEVFSNLTLEQLAGWDDAVAGCETIVHCAGLAHQPAGVDEKRMFAINGEAVGMLAVLARKHGVKRFIHLSSIRAVCGAASDGPLKEDASPAPIDVYGRSKLLGEHLAREAGIDGALLRLPLVIGAGAKANFGKVLHWARSPVPLPFAGIAAPRSVLGAATLADAVLTLAQLPPRAMQSMLIAESEPVSIAQMLSIMRKSLGRAPLLFSLGEPVLKTLVTTFLSAQAWDSLAKPLVLQPTRLAALGWQPPQSIADVIRDIMQGHA
jgi:nucleoside-diphosphate-sugar epimerase